MKCSEAMALFEEGKDIRRKEWGNETLKDREKSTLYPGNNKRILSLKDIKADDWEVVEELVELVDFNTMIEHLKKGGKAKRKEWEDIHICLSGKFLSMYNTPVTLGFVYHIEITLLETKDWILL